MTRSGIHLYLADTRAPTPGKRLVTGPQSRRQSTTTTTASCVTHPIYDSFLHHPYVFPRPLYSIILLATRNPRLQSHPRERTRRQQSVATLAQESHHHLASARLSTTQLDLANPALLFAALPSPLRPHRKSHISFGLPYISPSSALHPTSSTRTSSSTSPQPSLPLRLHLSPPLTLAGRRSTIPSD